MEVFHDAAVEGYEEVCLGEGGELLDDGCPELPELVLQLADKWELTVTAEGVETQEQLDWLAEHSCELVQGYALGAPSDATAVPSSSRLGHASPTAAAVASSS